MRIASKVALVTGASSGIGQALTEELHRRGAHLALTARSLAPGGPHLAIPGDLTDPAFRARLVEETLARYGRVDLLIHNAGVGLYTPPGATAAAADLEHMFALNFFAAVDLAARLVPGMRDRREGMVVAVGSLAGRVVLPWFPLYSASKFALGAWLDGLRMELSGSGVGALLVCPGYVRTGFAAHLLGGPAPGTLATGGTQLVTTPGRVAAATCDGIEAGRRTVVVPASGRAFLALARWAPRLVERLLVRQMRRAV